MLPIRCATVVELRLQQIGDFYEKPHFTMDNIKFRGRGCKVGVENFCTKLPKAHPYAKSGRTNRLAYCSSDVVLTLYIGEKKVRENRHWKLNVVYDTAAATALP